MSRATFGAGYGSSSRVYEGASRQLGMTPGAYQRGGAGISIDYAVTKTSLGFLLVAATERGVCAVSLGTDAAKLEAALAAEYPAASRRRSSEATGGLAVWIKEIVGDLEGAHTGADIPLDLQATAFQWKVWRELQKIPRGQTRSYTEIAAAIASPKSARAVATACAANRVALVVPCHRVVRQSGELAGYRWGIETKRQLLQKENDARKGVSS